MSAPTEVQEARDLLDRADEALEGVSPGPWRWEPSKHVRSGYVITAQNRTAVHATDWNADYGPFPEQFNHADARFAAEARTLVPELAAELSRLRAQETRIRALLTDRQTVGWVEQDAPAFIAVPAVLAALDTEEKQA